MCVCRGPGRLEVEGVDILPESEGQDPAKVPRGMETPEGTQGSVRVTRCKKSSRTPEGSWDCPQGIKGATPEMFFPEPREGPQRRLRGHAGPEWGAGRGPGTEGNKAVVARWGSWAPGSPWTNPRRRHMDRQRVSAPTPVQRGPASGGARDPWARKDPHPPRQRLSPPRPAGARGRASDHPKPV